MTNKMPVVGQRYARKSLGCDYQIIVEKILDDRHIICAIVPDGKTKWNRFTYQPHYFWDDYKELPSNSQETEEVQVEEVNEVERALEELKKELFNKRDCHFTRIDKLENLAQRLIDVLEAEKNMSKPEPKIDMKKECVEPVSIWKNGDELEELEKQNEQFLIRTKDKRVIMPILPNIFTDDNQINKNIKEATTLTDLIDSFEQMQKDIEELKKSGK